MRCALLTITEIIYMYSEEGFNIIFRECNFHYFGVKIIITVETESTIWIQNWFDGIILFIFVWNLLYVTLRDDALVVTSHRIQ